MAVVGAAFVRVKLLSDKLGKEIERDVSTALKSSNIDKVANDLGDKVGKRVADGIKDHVDDSAETVGKRLHRELEAAVKDIDVKVNTKGIQGDLDKLKDISIDVDADTLRARQAIDDIADDVPTVSLDVDLHAKEVSAKLAWLARMRKAVIVPVLNGKAYAAVEAALRRLSGFRVLQDWGRRVKDIAANIDRLAPKFGVLSAGMLGLAGAATALTSNVFGIVYSLGAIAPAALALPGMFAGAAFGIGTLVAVMKDMKTVLKDLGPEFGKLQDYMSGQFWGQAEKPIRNMLKNFLAMKPELGALSAGMGVFATKIADTVSSSVGMQMMRGTIKNTTDAVLIGAEGVSSWVEAFLRLGAVGSSYLPVLGSWLNKVGADFNKWITDSTESGEIFGWIDNGIVQLKALGTVLVQTIGIFEAIGRAATAAGGSGLVQMAEGLRGINAALSGTQGQEAMIMLFTAGHQAMQAMVPGLREFGAAFRDDIIPLLSTALPKAGEGLSAVFSTLAGVFSNPAFAAGFTAMLDGVVDGLQSLQGVSGPLGGLLGSIAGAFGSVARAVLGVLAAGIENFGPMLSQMFDAISAVAPVLGGALVGAMEALAPAITAVIGGLMEFIAQNPGFAAGIGAVVVGVGALVGGLFSLVGPLSNIIGPIQGVVTHFGGLSAVIPKVLGFLKGFGVAGLVVSLLVGMYAASEPFREAVGRLGEALGSILVPMIGSFAGALSGLGPFIGAALGLLGDLAAIVLNNLIPAIEFVAPAFQVAFGILGTILSGAMEVATGILNGFRAFLTGDFAGGLDIIGSAFGNVFGPLGDIVGGGLDGAMGAITEWLGGAGEAVSGGVEGIGQTVGGWADGFGETVSTGFDSALTGITDWGTGVGEAVGTGLSDAGTFVTEGLAGIGETISGWAGAAGEFFAPMLDAVGSIFGSLIDIITAPWTALFDGIGATVAAGFLIILDLFTGNFAGIGVTVMAWVTTIQGIFGNMWATIGGALSNMWSIIHGVFSAGLAAVIGFVSSLWTGIQAAFTTGVMVVVGFMSALPGQIMGAIVGLTMSMAAWANSTWANVTAAFVGGVSRVVAFAQALPGRVVSAVVGLVGQLAAWAVSTWNGVVARFNAGVAQAVAAAIRITTGVMGAVRALPGQMAAVGANIISSLASAIAGGASRVIAAAANMAKNVISAAKNALGIRSPSKIFTEIGEFLGDGLILGISKSEHPVKRAADQLADKVVKAFEEREKGIEERLKAGGLSRAAAARLTAQNIQGQNALLNYINRQSSQIENAVKAREKVTEQLKDAEKLLAEAVSERDNFIKGVSNKVLSAGALKGDMMVESLARSVETAKNFRDALKKLTASGLNDTALKQIMEAGPAAGLKLANQILNGGDGMVNELNGLQKELDAVAKDIGDSSGKALYQAGVDAAQGLVDGLQAKEAQLESAAKKLADALAAEVRRALGIASPSKVFREIGKFVGMGFISGLGEMEARIARAGNSLVGAALPGSIPRLASGGIVRPSGGGTLALLAEAGRSERVEPLDSAGMSKRDRALLAAIQGISGNGSITIGEVVVPLEDLSQLKTLNQFVDMLRVNTRKRSGHA